MNRESENGEYLKSDVFISYYENSVRGKIYFQKRMYNEGGNEGGKVLWRRWLCWTLQDQQNLIGGWIKEVNRRLELGNPIKVNKLIYRVENENQGEMSLERKVGSWE